jgi:F-type H+-transporting ATPase subunit delta
MHAASRRALAELRDQTAAVFARFSTSEGLTGLADELYAVVDLLNGQPQLRRRLADPSTDSAKRSGLAGALFEGRVGASAVQIVKDAVALRWSSGWDLLDALEITADDGLLGAAEQEGRLDAIEDELFRFERILDGDSRLTTLLDDQSAEAARRAALVASLVDGKVDDITARLLRHAVASQRKRSVVHAVDDLLELAAQRRNRSTARVISAIALTSAQERQLAAALTTMYGRSITVRTAVEPGIRGGLVVRVGDEVIDGSILARLNGARAAIAG